MSGAADGGNLDLTHPRASPCPALCCLPGLPCLGQENLARLRVVDFGSGLWTLDSGFWTLDSGLWTSSFCLCCRAFMLSNTRSLTHSLTPSRPNSGMLLRSTATPRYAALLPLSLSLWILDQTRRSWRLQLCEGFFAQAKTLDLGILEPVEQSCWVSTLRAAGLSGTRPPLLCVLQALKRA